MKSIFIILLFICCGVNAQTYYVTTSGSGSTCSSGSPCSITYAFANASAGETWYIKAGDYGDITGTISNSGTSGNPIKFIGYKTTIGDIVASNGSTFGYGDSVDSAEMPLFDGSNGTGRAIYSSNKNYIEISNIQLTKYQYGLYMSGSNTVLDNIIMVQMGVYTNTSFNGWGMRLDSNNADVRNCILVNATGEGYSIRGNDGYYEYNEVFHDDNRNGLDYYFKIHYGANNNEFRNIHVERKESVTQHWGHGISVKAETAETQNDGGVGNNFYDCTVVNTTIELSRAESNNNNFYRCDVIGNHSDGKGGIVIRDGSHSNYFEDCTNTGANRGITFGWYNNLGGDTMGAEDENGGHDNLFYQCTFSGATTAPINFFSYNSLPQENYDGIVYDNTFEECTFSDTDALFLVDRPNTNTQLINCTLTNITELSTYDTTRGASETLNWKHQCTTESNLGWTLEAESDLGATCGAPYTCVDGIKNQDEVNVDCGGVCSDCSSRTKMGSALKATIGGKNVGIFIEN